VLGEVLLSQRLGMPHLSDSAVLKLDPFIRSPQEQISTGFERTQ
jgi:hypothetical protein